MPKRMTGLALVIALSGSPAVLSACMAVCLQGVATAASHTDTQATGHAAHVTATVSAVASAHAHHASPVSNESAATGLATASSHDSFERRLSAPCTNCCPEGPAMSVAGPGVERIDTKSFSATPIALRVTSFLVTTPDLGASPPRPPVSPPSPTRALLVLRI